MLNTALHLSRGDHTEDAVALPSQPKKGFSLRALLSRLFSRNKPDGYYADVFTPEWAEEEHKITQAIAKLNAR